MGKLIINLALIIVTGLVFCWSYYSLINKFNENRTKAAQHYLSQVQAIEELQLTNPSPLTQNTVLEYDKEHNTNISAGVDKITSMQMPHYYMAMQTPHNPRKIAKQEALTEALNLLKNENAEKASEITSNEMGFWSYLPPIHAIIFGCIGIFFTTLITNFGNDIYATFSVYICRKIRTYKQSRAK
jgi:hypothetical protein